MPNSKLHTTDLIPTTFESDLVESRGGVGASHFSNHLLLDTFYIFLTYVNNK